MLISVFVLKVQLVVQNKSADQRACSSGISVFTTNAKILGLMLCFQNPREDKNEDLEGYKHSGVTT